MRPLREITVGLLGMVVTTLMVIGAVSASVSEALLAAIVEEEPVPELSILTIIPGMPTTKPQNTRAPKIITLTPTAVFICPTPKEWELYTVQPGDTLDELASDRNVSSRRIMEGNCLLSPALMSGTTLRLPKAILPSITLTTTKSTLTLTVTVTATRCGAPRNWARYTVQPNDTLFKLSSQFKVSVPELQLANCMNDTVIRAGSILYVPNIATRTPSPSPIPPTATPIPATLTRVNTTSPTLPFTRTSTFSASSTSTKPATPTATSIAIKTLTPTAATSTPPPASTSTSTVIFTSTPTK